MKDWDNHDIPLRDLLKPTPFHPTDEPQEDNGDIPERYR